MKRLESTIRIATSALRFCVFARGTCFVLVLVFLLLGLQAPASAQAPMTVFVPASPDGKAASAPTINDALALMDPEKGGTIRVIKRRNFLSDPGFAAVGFKNLTILLQPVTDVNVPPGPLPVTNTSALIGCTAVKLTGFSFEMGLEVTECDGVRFEGANEITGGLWITAANRVFVSTVLFNGAGSPGAIVVSSMGATSAAAPTAPGLAKLAASWGSNFLMSTPEAPVHFSACRFEGLGPAPGVVAKASHVKIQGCRFTDLKSTGVEGVHGSAVQISSCYFKNTTGTAVCSIDSLLYMNEGQIDFVLPGTRALSRGIEAINTGPNLAAATLGASASHTVLHGPNISGAGVGILVFGGKGEFGHAPTGSLNAGQPRTVVPSVKQCPFGLVLLDNFRGEVGASILLTKLAGLILGGSDSPVRLHQIGLRGTTGFSFVIAACRDVSMENVNVQPDIAAGSGAVTRGGGSAVLGAGVRMKDVEIRSVDGSAALELIPVGGVMNGGIVLTIPVVRAENLKVADIGGIGVAVRRGRLEGSASIHTCSGIGLKVEDGCTVALSGGLIGSNAGGDVDVEGESTVQLVGVRMDRTAQQWQTGTGTNSYFRHREEDRGRWRPASIRVAGGASLTLDKGSLVQGGGPALKSGPWTGILVESGGSAVVRQNRIASGGWERPEAGVRVAAGGRLEMSGASLDHLATGVSVDQGGKADIRGCKFEYVKQPVISAGQPVTVGPGPVVIGAGR